MRIALISFLLIFICLKTCSQTFISDRQNTIAKGATEIKEYPPHERKIILDSINGQIKIEMLDGHTLYRNVRFVDNSYENYGIVYAGYYETPQKEKIYIRNNEIGFHAMNTLGYFYTYSLKGAKQISDEEEVIELEKNMYENILSTYGFHDAVCFKYKKIEIGINRSTVDNILDMKPLYEESFFKDGEFIDIVVFPQYIIRFEGLTVSKVVPLK